ncbi:MAG: hypothetical protein DHS20C09_18800 [marine bacterium B5-7]|nr:MAG: hypothetical protein DHS20C09_18800 [marine bacterium B5-7]
MNNIKRRERLDSGLNKEVPDIFVAAENNDVSALKIALRHANVNAQDEIGMTPLHYAASTMSEEAIDVLLDAQDIDPTLADKFGRSAASLAFECWNILALDLVNKLKPHCYPWLFEDSPDRAL